MTMAECNIPNCRRNAPAGEAFCSEHRDLPARRSLRGSWVVTAIMPAGKGVTVCRTPEQVIAAIADALEAPYGAVRVERLKIIP